MQGTNLIFDQRKNPPKQMKGSLSSQEQVKILRQKNDRLWDLINYQAAEIQSLKDQLRQKCQAQSHVYKKSQQKEKANNTSQKQAIDNQESISQDSNKACEDCKKQECRFADYMFDGIYKWRYGYGACGPNPNTHCHCTCHQQKPRQAIEDNTQIKTPQTSDVCNHQWHCLKHGYNVKVGDGCYIEGYGFGICCQVGQQHGTYYYCCVQCKLCSERKAKGSSWPELEIKQRIN